MDTLTTIIKKENLYLLCLLGVLCWFIERGSDLLIDQYKESSTRVEMAVEKNTVAIGLLNSTMNDAIVSLNNQVQSINNNLALRDERGLAIVKDLKQEDRSIRKDLMNEVQKLWKAIEELKK
jgi:hypothetical protein